MRHLMCRRVVSFVTEVLRDEALRIIQQAGVVAPEDRALRSGSLQSGIRIMARDLAATLERRYAVSTDAVWTAWTTAEAVAAWWGPRGFVTTILELSPHAAGGFRYEMTAEAPQVVRFMDAHGLPRSTVVCGYFKDVVELERLTVVQLVDFVPGVQPYEVSSSLVLRPAKADTGCLARLTIDRMHDDEWSERTIDGWRGQLRRLAAYLIRHSVP